MLQLELNSNAPTAAVLKVRLRAEPVKPRRTQQGLFVPSAPEAEKLELTLARVKHLVGAGRVGIPELSNTHRPDSFTLHPSFSVSQNPGNAGGAVDSTCRLSLRRYRPPRHTQVLVVNHQPVRIISPSISGRVVMAKGPWRTSGDWWKSGELEKEAAAWNRDEWDVALESGALYRLFEEAGSRRWFIEGSYD